MRTTLRIALLSLLLAATSWSVLQAAAPQRDGVTPTQSREISLEEAAAHKRPVRDTPLNREIHKALEQQRKELDDLTARFRVAATNEEGLAIQREIARVKQQGEVDLLVIQARHMRDAGHAAKASDLESIIDTMQQRIDDRFRAVGSTTVPSRTEQK